MEVSTVNLCRMRVLVYFRLMAQKEEEMLLTYLWPPDGPGSLPFPACCLPHRCRFPHPLSGSVLSLGSHWDKYGNVHRPARCPVHSWTCAENKIQSWAENREADVKLASGPHQRCSGKGEPKKGQSRKVRLFSMTWISWFLGPSIMGERSTTRSTVLLVSQNFKMINPFLPL